jgi:hypothetical protein
MARSEDHINSVRDAISDYPKTSIMMMSAQLNIPKSTRIVKLDINPRSNRALLTMIVPDDWSLLTGCADGWRELLELLQSILCCKASVVKCPPKIKKIVAKCPFLQSVRPKSV